MLSTLLQGLRGFALLRVRADRVRASPASLVGLCIIALVATGFAQRHWYFAQDPEFNPVGLRDTLSDLPLWLLAGWLLARRTGVGALWLPVLLTAAQPWLAGLEAILVRAADAADLLDAPPADLLWLAQWGLPACWPVAVALAAAARLPGVRGYAFAAVGPVMLAALIDLWLPHDAIWVPPEPSGFDEVALAPPGAMHLPGAPRVAPASA